MRQFIFTLGSDFTQIQNNFRIGLLPDEWKTQDWPSLLVLCRNYAHSVRPQGLTKFVPCWTLLMMVRLTARSTTRKSNSGL
jgi:hypothetical protein